MSGIRVHPRAQQVSIIESTARLAMEETLHNAEIELTDWEKVRIITGVCTSLLQSLARVNIRVERHGNPDAWGDSANG